MMKGFKSLALLTIVGMLAMFWSSMVFAADGTLTILATSDMHSVLKPYGKYTNGEYQWGGFIRMAERIIEKKVQYMSQGNGVLVLDGGDIVAGTYFHYAYKGVAEMVLMSSLYDATTLGNHEFDWTPDALAGAIQSVLQLPQGITPVPFVNSNITSWGDSPLQAFKGSIIQTTLMKDAAGIKVGIFGLMTKGTAALAQPAPIEFSDLSTSAGLTGALGVAGSLQAQGADVIVCLAHNGLGYDLALAQYAAAYGVKLDVILSAHDHVANPSVIKVGNTQIIQVGAYSSYLGRLTLNVQNKTVTSYDFDLETIDSSNSNISGTPTPNLDSTGWATLVGTFNSFANPAEMAAQIGQAYPLGWNEPTADGVTWGDFSGGNEQDALGIVQLWQTYDITKAFDQMSTSLYHTIPGTYQNPPFWAPVAATTQKDLILNRMSESNLGNLVSDSIFLRGALVDLGDENNTLLGLPGTPNDQVTDFAVEASGTIRFNIPADDNGITLSDAYQVLPLGIGLKSFDLVNGTLPVDSSGNFEVAPGFDLMRFYMKGSDLKTSIEMGVAAQELGDVFFLNWSGLSFDYDLSKPILQRVSNLKIAGADLVTSAVYKGTTSTYVGSSFLLLKNLLEPALNTNILTQEQYDTITGMVIYSDYQATTPITDITASLASLYAGKEWLAFADKIMWPWWYGGLNGTVWDKSPVTNQNLYGTTDGRMHDVTSSNARINLNVKGSKFYVPKIISRLLGKKAGDQGYSPLYDLNRDGLINNRDLAIAIKSAK